MSHIYTCTKVTVVGDSVMVVGTVDGTPVTVNFWASAVGGMTQAEQVAFVAQQMLAALPPASTDLTSQYPTSVTI